MRRVLIGAVGAAALAVPAVALAQNPVPVVTPDVRITPSDAGTSRSPKASKFTFTVVNSAESKTTVSRIQLDMPTGVRLSGAGLDTCSVATLRRGPGACPRGSRLGSGVSYAFLVTPAPPPDCPGTRGAAPGCLTFETQFFVGGRNLLSVFLSQRGGGVQQPLQGVISRSGRRLTIEIPTNLQSPAPNVYSALAQLGGSFQRSKTTRGRRYSFVSTTSCPSSRRWAVRSTFFYVNNIAPAPVASRSGESRVSCRR